MLQPPSSDQTGDSTRLSDIVPRLKHPDMPVSFSEYGGAFGDVFFMGNGQRRYIPSGKTHLALWARETKIIGHNDEVNNSRPWYQFEYQRGREAWRIEFEDSRPMKERNRTLEHQHGDDYNESARKTIENRWKEQGIWNDKWTSSPEGCWRWKHEETPESGQLAAHALETDASRPFHQFHYQVMKEREWLDGDVIRGEPTLFWARRPSAYHAIEACWHAQGIWKKDWGHTPGMTWRHEHPEEYVAGDKGAGPSLSSSLPGPQNFSLPATASTSRSIASNALQSTTAKPNEGSPGPIERSQLSSQTSGQQISNFQDCQRDTQHEVKDRSTRKNQKVPGKARKSVGFVDDKESMSAAKGSTASTKRAPRQRNVLVVRAEPKDVTASLVTLTRTAGAAPKPPALKHSSKVAISASESRSLRRSQRIKDLQTKIEKKVSPATPVRQMTEQTVPKSRSRPPPTSKKLKDTKSAA